METTEAAWRELCPVITVHHTVMDGQVVRWYASVAGAENARVVVSASRNGVTVSAEHLDERRAKVLAELLCHAAECSHELAYGRDLRGLATHRFKGLMGPLEAVGGEGDGVQ